jgi:hypothetical protein
VWNRLHLRKRLQVSVGTDLCHQTKLEKVLENMAVSEATTLVIKRKLDEKCESLQSIGKSTAS